jgi:exodeoxyribonuclease VIII
MDKNKQGIVIESNKDYHSDLTAISKSRLAKMSVCPQYFKWCEDNPQEPSEDLIVGSAFHKLVLEPETFGTEFVVMPNIDRRTKQGKELYEQFIITSQGRDILTQEQYEMICAMRDSVLSNKYAVALLKGNHEHSFYTQDELTKEIVKVRPDCYRNVQDRIVITDLKSCRSAITEDFMRDVVKYSYDLQAYMYTLAVSKVMNIPQENVDFVFIAVEKKAPYMINMLQADQFVLERGEALFREYIGKYHECKETNNWYGLNGAYGIINNLSLPNYLLKEVIKGE